MCGHVWPQDTQVGIRDSWDKVHGTQDDLLGEEDQLKRSATMVSQLRKRNLLDSCVSGIFLRKERFLRLPFVQADRSRRSLHVSLNDGFDFLGLFFTKLEGVSQYETQKQRYRRAVTDSFLVQNVTTRVENSREGISPSIYQRNAPKAFVVFHIVIRREHAGNRPGDFTPDHQRDVHLHGNAQGCDFDSGMGVPVHIPHDLKAQAI